MIQDLIIIGVSGLWVLFRVGILFALLVLSMLAGRKILKKMSK
jgi:hypothetical protein